MLNKIDILNPIFLHIVGLFLFIFIPPLIFGGDFHFEGLVSDLLGLSFFCLGGLFAILYSRVVIKDKKLYFSEDKLTLCVITFIILIWPIRIYLIEAYGISALFHAFSRPPSLIDTFAQQLSWPYITLLMTAIITTGRSYFKLLFLLELAYVVLPTLSRAYFVYLFAFYAVGVYFFTNINLTKVFKKFLFPFLIVILLIAIAGSVMGTIRSVFQVGGTISDVISLDLSDYVDLSFLGRRLNMHNHIFQFSLVIEDAIRIELKSWEGIFNKLLFFENYEIHPTSVSRRVGLLIGYGIKTSTEVPRNYILGNYPLGILSIILYNFIWAFILMLIYKLISTTKNIMFLPLWITFIFSQAFGSIGAFPSTHAFQFIFTIFVWSVFYIVYKLLDLLLKVRIKKKYIKTFS